jgi:superfamily II DNA/RNA helicase
LALQTKKTIDSVTRFCPIKSGLIIGGEAFKFQVATFRKNPEVIIATPGRLVEHIERGSPDFTDLEVLILDEADRMLEMGFAEDMNTIAAACKSDRQNLLFSATLKHKGLVHIRDILDKPKSIVVDPPRQVHNQIVQQIVLADDTDHKEKLTLAVIDEEQANKVIVFCKTREQCGQLGSALTQRGRKVGVIHGEISQSDRKQVMNRFRDNKLQILVATDLAARGLDIDSVDLVVNFSVAQSGDDHVHRVGRTGRAGEQGKAVTLVSSTEWNLMSSIERYLKTHFERRKIKGVVAQFTGPKKLKKSGKAAGSKKKKSDSPPWSRQSVRNRTVKSKHKKRKGKQSPKDDARDGFSPPKKQS